MRQYKVAEQPIPYQVPVPDAAQFAAKKSLSAFRLDELGTETDHIRTPKNIRILRLATRRSASSSANCQSRATNVSTLVNAVTRTLCQPEGRTSTGIEPTAAAAKVVWLWDVVADLGVGAPALVANGGNSLTLSANSSNQT